jgi:hypothetical protein
MKIRRGARWVDPLAHDPRGEEMSALSVTGEGPGLRALLSVLEGYTWSPHPASEGHHALVKARLVDHDQDETREQIEFVVGRGQIEDVRRGQRAVIPGDQAGALRQLALQLVVGRLGLGRQQRQERA